jgi:hypothetical protein
MTYIRLFRATALFIHLPHIDDKSECQRLQMRVCVIYTVRHTCVDSAFSATWLMYANYADRIDQRRIIRQGKNQARSVFQVVFEGGMR